MTELNQSAFPRSGTNTLNIGLALCFPQHQVNAPEYSPRSIKNKDNTFVVFRNPLDAIASWTHYSDYMRQTTTLDAIIDWWIVFAETTLECLDKVFMTTFDVLINDHSYAFSAYSKKFNLDKPQDVPRETIELQVETNFPTNFPRPHIVIPESLRLKISESKSYSNADKLWVSIKNQQRGAHD